MPVGEVPYDALVTLLVFMVGVPAVVLQTLPPEIRRVTTKRWARLLADLAAPAIFALAVSLAGVLAPRLSVQIERLTWSGVLGVLVLTALYTAFRILGRYGRRIAIVRSLEREVGARIRTNGRLREEPLADLVDLGRQSQPGREKEMVLEALRALTGRVMARPGYAGDGLEDLALGVLDIVIPLPLLRNAQNFSSAAAIFQDIVLRYEGPASAGGASPLKHADLISALRALSKLGRASISLENDAVPLQIVQAISAARTPRAAIFVSQALFEVGMAALESEQILTGMSALEKMMMIIEARKPARGELVADALGLIAHFYAQGETGRAFAQARLDRLEGCLEQDMQTALSAAAAHCAQTTQFRTADRVRELQRALQDSAGAAE